MTNDELEKRERLPDALRVLMEEFPREEWQSSAGFEGLISFWLDRHLMFRRLMEAMIKDSEIVLDGNMELQTLQSRLARYGNTLVSQLHGHHHIEDAHYFPVLKTRDPRLTSGFDILDKDHHALDHHLEEFTGVANDILTLDPANPDQERFGNLNANLIGFTKFLDRHLVDEEELVVPVILKYGTQGLG